MSTGYIEHILGYLSITQFTCNLVYLWR